jgi:hypothetical protein
MKKLIVYFFLVINIGCSLEKETVIVKYRSTRSSQIYYLDVPIGFAFKGYGVTIESENQYIYNDSSFIYISNFKNTPNYYNIKELGDSIFQFRFQNEELVSELNQLIAKSIFNPLPDTFELSGQQKSGLYWKDIKLGQISVGYVNVPKEKRAIFDEAIESTRKTRKQNK